MNLQVSPLATSRKIRRQIDLVRKPLESNKPEGIKKRPPHLPVWWNLRKTERNGGGRDKEAVVNCKHHQHLSKGRLKSSITKNLRNKRSFLAAKLWTSKWILPPRRKKNDYISYHYSLSYTRQYGYGEYDGYHYWRAYCHIVTIIKVV